MHGVGCPLFVVEMSGIMKRHRGLTFSLSALNDGQNSGDGRGEDWIGVGWIEKGAFG